VAYARIALDLGRPAVSWFVRPYIAIDGEREETGWGPREHVVPAGEHLVEVWYRSWFGRDVQRAVLSLNLAANTEVQLRYRVARMRWNPAVLYQVGTAIATPVDPTPSLPKAAVRKQT